MTTKFVLLTLRLTFVRVGARNLGIEAAQGEYLGFIDSDDWAEPEMYRLMYEEAIKNESDLCYCYRTQVHETGKRSKDSASYFLPEGEVTEKSLCEMLVSHVTFVQRYLYKRALFMEHYIRFPSHIRYEDMMIDPLALLYVKNIAAVKVPLFNYFIRSGSTMTERNETKYIDKSTVCAMIIEEYKKRGYYGKYKEEINYLYYRKGYIHTSINYLLNAKTPSVKVVDEIRARLLAVSPDYRKTDYYKRKTTFCMIDRVLSSRCSVALRILKWMLKFVGYNV